MQRRDRDPALALLQRRVDRLKRLVAAEEEPGDRDRNVGGGYRTGRLGLSLLRRLNRRDRPRRQRFRVARPRGLPRTLELPPLYGPILFVAPEKLLLDRA